MTGFLDITAIRVPLKLAQEAHAHLQHVGRDGLEGFALWAGVRDSSTFNVRQTIIPEQIGMRTAEGVSVAVDAQELHRLNVWLYERQLSLVAQLHSHPSTAYHSDTDDAFPIATTIGCVSLVIPNFAREPFSLAHCAVYRLLPRRGWVNLTVAEVRHLIHIIE
jgi:hypothetical protein